MEKYIAQFILLMATTACTVILGVLINHYFKDQKSIIDSVKSRIDDKIDGFVDLLEQYKQQNTHYYNQILGRLGKNEERISCCEENIKSIVERIKKKEKTLLSCR